MDIGEYIGNNRIEDVKWLCSLSEAESDMMICLKTLGKQRAKVIGHDDLAKKFDLKMLRALGFILTEHIKGQMKETSVIPSFAESADFLNGCSFLNCDLSNAISSADLKTYVDISRKRKAEDKLRFRKHQPQFFSFYW